MRATKARERDLHIEVHGLTPGIKKRLELLSRQRSRNHASNEVMKSMSQEAITKYHFSLKLGKISSLAALFMFFSAFILLFGKFEEFIWIAVASLSIIWFSNSYRKQHESPVADAIKQRTDRLYPLLYGLFKEQRLAYQRFYGTPEWKNLRAKFISQERQRVGRLTCSICGYLVGSDITVDHIKPRSHYPELALSIKNLAIAHRSCNSAKGAKVPLQQKA